MSVSNSFCWIGAWEERVGLLLLAAGALMTGWIVGCTTTVDPDLSPVFGQDGTRPAGAIQTTTDWVSPDAATQQPEASGREEAPGSAERAREPFAGDASRADAAASWDGSQNHTGSVEVILTVDNGQLR